MLPGPHAGKSGDQRGSSAREDILDTVIKLSRPHDYRPEDGARFKVELTKARHFAGGQAADCLAALREDEDGRLFWDCD